MISISPPAGQLGPGKESAPEGATTGDVHTVTPPGWPRTTSSRHVNGVHDKHTAVEGALRLYPDTLAVTSDRRGGFDLHEDISVGIYADESVGLLQAVTDY